VAIWNSLPGVTPVKKFKDRTTSATRIWKSIQELGESVKPNPAQPLQRKAERKAKGATQLATGAPTKGKATKKATAAKNAPQGKRAAKAQEPTEPQEGSKTAQVVAMLQQERSQFGRDHGKDGMAKAYRQGLQGRRDEEGWIHRRVIQTGGRRAHLPWSDQRSCMKSTHDRS
jgi:hypothetical protein